MSERLTDKDSRILWEAIGAQSASVVTVRAVERIVEAHVAEALAPVLALAEIGVREQWPPDEWRAGILRAAADTPTHDTTEEETDVR